MKTLFRFRTIMALFVLFLLAVLSANCSPTSTPPSAISTSTTEADSETLAGPEGMLLTLEGKAVEIAPAVEMEVLADDTPALENTPFEAASPVYRLMLDSQPFSGGITLAVPFSGIADTSPGRLFHYAALVMTETSSPVLVGAVVDGDLIHFPVIGSGRYQVLRVPVLDGSAFEAIVTQPLSVPSYPQMTPSWCSTTTMTDLAGYHEGAWPSGGLGSLWGESSNWYLAGLGGQAYNRGYFFHWVLNAGGYSVPDDVKESFTNGNAEVIIWDWRSSQINDAEWQVPGINNLGTFSGQLAVTENILYAESLFDFFKAYVEEQVWGSQGDRRPVAWGSSLAGHSRIITGSDGTNFFFNNPSSGSWNDTKSWETYRQEVLDSLSASEQEVIDTVVFYAPVRPAEDRRAVLWLLQADSNQQGSILLKRSAEGTPAANWFWDGAFGHQYGYYYNDLIGDLPADPTFGVALKSTTPQDVIEYSYSVRSISDGSYDYEVQTRLYEAAGGTQVYYGENQVSVGGGERVNFFPAGTIPIGNLPAGLYYLKFTLMMGGVTEDVKYVYFPLAEHDPYHFNVGSLREKSNCRKGPGIAYEITTPLDAGLEVTLVGLSPDWDWGQVEAMVGTTPVRCWVGMDRLEFPGSWNVPVVTVEPVAPAVVCSDYVTPGSCTSHSQCTWAVGAFGPGACKAK